MKKYPKRHMQSYETVTKHGPLFNLWVKHKQKQWYCGKQQYVWFTAVRFSSSSEERPIRMKESIYSCSKIEDIKRWFFSDAYYSKRDSLIIQVFDEAIGVRL